MTAFATGDQCELVDGRCVTCGTTGYSPDELEQFRRDIAVLSRAALTPMPEAIGGWWRIVPKGHNLADAFARRFPSRQEAEECRALMGGGALFEVVPCGPSQEEAA